MKLTITFDPKDWAARPIIKDDRGQFLPNIKSCDVSTHVERLAEVTLVLLIDQENVVLGVPKEAP